MILYYPIAIYLAYQVYYFSTQATQHYQISISYLNISNQSELAWKTLLEALTLNLYEGASEIRDKITLATEQANVFLDDATYYAIYFSVASALFFSYLIFIKKASKNQLIIHSSVLAFICLLVGITSTMLSIIAFRDLPVIGMVVFKFESKTVLSVLQTFLDNQKYFIFILILLFSVMIPIMKLIVSLIVAVFGVKKTTKKFIYMVNVIGKWSMTDVFVVAVLLAFFTMNIDKSTDAWLGHGLYFFAIYSILSIIIGQIINNNFSVNDGEESINEAKA